MNRYIVKMCGETHHIEANSVVYCPDRPTVEFYGPGTWGSKDSLVAAFHGIDMFAIVPKNILEIESKKS